MNRPRSPGRKDLPPWFRVIVKGGHTSYAIEHPVTREWCTLGKDKAEALALYWQLAPEILAQVDAAPHHYNYVRAVLTRALLQHAVDESTLSANPMRAIEARAKPKRTTYVPDSHYVAITEHIAAEYARRACDLLYLLGTRPSDGLGLTVDSLVKEGNLWCVAFAAAKTGEEQELISNQALHDELEWWRAWRLQHAPMSKHLIVHPRDAGRKINSRPISADWLSRVWRAAADKAGFPDYTLRDLRPKSITDESLLGNQDNKGGHTEAMRKHYTRVRLPTRARVTVELPKRKTAP